jgi:hypothetical protein
MVQHWKAICATGPVRYTKRDALISAGVLMGATIAMLAAGNLVGRQGYPELGDALKALAFPLSFAVSMPFAILKGQPRAVQTVTLGFTVSILLIATWISIKI